MNLKGKYLASSIFAFAVLISFISASPIKNQNPSQDAKQTSSSQSRTKRDALDNQDGRPWWHKPCGPVHNHHRHSKSKECTEPRIIHKSKLRPLIQQLKKFRSFYRHQTTRIEEYYNNERNCKQLTKSEYEYDWLPQKPKVKTFKNKSEEALIQFHKEIQIFAVALHQLQKTMDPEMFGVETRNELLNQISLEMRAVMCELEALVNHTCKNLVVDRIPLDYLQQNSLKWTSSTDFTNMCIQDRGVLQAYHDFIKGWKHVFQSIKKDRNGKKKNQKPAIKKTQDTKNHKTQNKNQQKLGNPNTRNRQRIPNNKKLTSQKPSQNKKPINVQDKQKTRLRIQERRRKNQRKMLRKIVSSTTRRPKTPKQRSRSNSSSKIKKETT